MSLMPAQSVEASACGLGKVLRVATLNVDGCGAYKSSPPVRMGLMLDALTSLDLDAICFQEVVDEMNAVICQRLRLHGWKVCRKKDRQEDYYLVTAVKTISSNQDDKCISEVLPGSNNGRRLLIVRRGPWTIVNVHAKSGGRKREVQVRARQLEFMSQIPSRLDKMQTYVLIGDFNLRVGED